MVAAVGVKAESPVLSASPFPSHSFDPLPRILSDGDSLTRMLFDGGPLRRILFDDRTR